MEVIKEMDQQYRPGPTRAELSGDATQAATLVVDRPGSGVLVLCLQAALDQPSCEALEARIEDELAREATCRLVVDLHAVTLLSAAAVRMLVRLRRLAWLRDMRLVLVGASHHAVHVPLHTAGVLPLFDTRPTVLHALPTPAMSATRPNGRNGTGA
jgi:anti-anti-sigma factor